MQIEGYQVLEKIGEGGMASVYKGFQLSLKRDVAIKTLSPELSNQKGFNQRFERESLIIARLSSPYIIPIIEKGITDDNIPYFIMEYVEGSDLKMAMKSEQLEFNQKLDICLQITKALSYAHKNGVIHRDIKPANILIDLEGNAKVMDFGIAQYYSDDIDGQKTQMGDTMGTLAYMSPEQHQSASLVTFKSDLYSLGILMYKLFTRCDPIGRFKSPSEIDYKIPKVLDDIILSCLATEPEQRPNSADIIKNHLLQALGGAHLETQQKIRANTGIKNLELLDIIKEEGQMTVSLYENKADGSLLIINKRPANYPGYSESKLLTTLKHKSIGNILGTSQSDKFYIVVMSYNNGGELKDRLANPMDLKTFLPMAIDIVSGLLFAHNNRIIHGNLRPSTILFDQNEQVKITGFGLRNPEKTNKASVSRYKTAADLTATIQADIYALGVVFFEMLTAQYPILTGEQFTQNKYFRQLPLQIKQLLIHMLKKNPRERPNNCLNIEKTLNDIFVSRTHMDEEKTEISEVEINAKKSLPVKPIIYLSLSLMTLLIIAIYFSDMVDFFGQLFSSTEPEQEIDTPNYIEF